MKTAITSPCLTASNFKRAESILDNINNAFEIDSEGGTAGGIASFLSLKEDFEGSVLPDEALKLINEGENVYLSVDSRFYKFSHDDIGSNRNAWNILRGLELEEFGQGDGDGYNIVSHIVNLK